MMLQAHYCRAHYTLHNEAQAAQRGQSFEATTHLDGAFFDIRSRFLQVQLHDEFGFPAFYYICLN